MRNIRVEKPMEKRMSITLKFLPTLALGALVIATAIGVSARHAQANAPQPLPPSIMQKYAMQPLGSGELERFFFHVYDAHLFTPQKSAWSMQAPFALSLEYHMNFTKQEILTTTYEEIERVSGIPASEAKAKWDEKLLTLFPDVKPGDRITALFTPPGKVQFFHNNTATGTLQDEGFASPFFAIWLGEKTSEPAMRQQLLGLK